MRVVEIITAARPMPDDGRIGKSIDWSLVIPSIIRPVWEPPALEVLDRFEEANAEFSLNLKHSKFKIEILDDEARLQLLDLLYEVVPLNVFGKWAKESRGTAREVGDQRKVEFYESLLEALTFDVKEVYNELVCYNNSYDVGRPMPSIHSSYLESGDSSESGGEVSPAVDQRVSRPISLHSLGYPQQQPPNTNPIECQEEPSNFSNLDPRPAGKVKAASNSALRESKKAGTFGAMARRLRCASPSSDSE